MRISDWSSDVCSSDLSRAPCPTTRSACGTTRLPHPLALSEVEGAGRRPDGCATYLDAATYASPSRAPAGLTLEVTRARAWTLLVGAAIGSEAGRERVCQ